MKAATAALFIATVVSSAQAQQPPSAQRTAPTPQPTPVPTATVAAPASVPLSDKPPALAMDAKTLARALARYDHEPTVGDVVRAATAALPAADDDAAARARTAGWVPRVSLRARRGQAVDLDTSGDGGSDLRLSTDDDLTLEAGLTFDLDRIVFRREETAIAREQRASEEQAQARIERVVQLYFERRRLQLQRDLSPAPSGTLSLRIAELEATLDIFTNGAFRRMMGSNTWTTDASTPATRPKSRRKSSSTATSSSAPRATSPRAASR